MNGSLSAMGLIVERLSMLEHSFYVDWNKGEIPPEAMKHYALEWISVERQFTRFLSKAHAQCDVQEVRQAIANNLGDEEGGNDTPSHLELWYDYARAWSCTEEEIANAKPGVHTLALIDAYSDLCSSYGWKAAVCAMYAYESQIPEIAKVKIASLRDRYGITSEQALKFFQVHSEMDVWHTRVWSDIIKAYFTKKDVAMAKEVTEIAAMHLLHFLDGINEYRKCACHSARAIAVTA